jgi:hypothetical protein
MKIQGKSISGPEVDVLVIPRKSGDILFKAQSVLDYDAFEALCPAPHPPETLRPGGGKGLRTRNLEAPEFLKALDDWSEKRTYWMILKSLEATPDLEWETIKMDDPSTWSNYEKELKSAGFSMLEITRILNLVTGVCGLDQRKIDEATARFLATMVVPQK